MKSSVIVFVSLGVVTAHYAQVPDDQNPIISETISEGEAIISEKDAVDLVEDSSVGEAIQRRPDLDFSNVTIDGEGSNVSLDSISADSVESVEVMKAVTPDLDADSRGGSVILKYKPAYQQEAVIRKGSLEWTHDSLYGINGYDASFSIGGRIGESDSLGGRLSFRVTDSITAQETAQFDWKSVENDGESQFVLDDFSLHVLQWNPISKEIGAALDYKLSEYWSLFWRGNYTRKDSHGTRPRSEYVFGEGEYLDAGEGGAAVDGALLRRGIISWDSSTDEIEAVLGGAYENGKSEIDFKLTYKDEVFEEPRTFLVDFTQREVDLNYQFNGPLEMVVEPRGDHEFSNPVLYEFEDLNFQTWDFLESDLIGAVDWKLTAPFGQEGAFFKAGAKSRARERELVSRGSIYDRYDSSFVLQDFLSDLAFDRHSDGRYILDTIPDSIGARSFAEENIENFDLNLRRTRERSDPYSYFADEDVYSYYAMYSWERKNWRAIFGWRHEETKVSFIGNEVILGEDELGETIYIATNPTIGKSSYGNDFPNAHFRYRFNDRLSLIGSYSETIERPRYGSVVPFRRVNLELREINEGNPDLKPTLYANWDLSFDYSLSDQALLSVELFDRDVEDFLFNRTSKVVGGIYDGFESTRPENSSSAGLRGVSATWKQPLIFFGIPEGFSFNAKLTEQSTEIRYPARPDELLPLTEWPDREVNLTLNYESDRFFAQLKYEYEDQVILSVAEDASEDRFRHPFTHLGLDINYRIRDKVRLFLKLDNIKSESDNNSFEAEESRPIRHRTVGWSGGVGVRFEL